MNKTLLEEYIKYIIKYRPKEHKNYCNKEYYENLLRFQFDSITISYKIKEILFDKLPFDKNPLDLKDVYYRAGCYCCGGGLPRGIMNRIVDNNIIHFSACKSDEKILHEYFGKMGNVVPKYINYEIFAKNENWILENLNVKKEVKLNFYRFKFPFPDNADEELIKYKKFVNEMETSGKTKRNLKYEKDLWEFINEK